MKSMKEEIIEIKIEELTIKKSDNGSYYVVAWKDGHYEIKDVIEECEQTIKILKEFEKKYNTPAPKAEI